MNKPSEAQAEAMADFYKNNPKTTKALGVAEKILPMAAQTMGIIAGGALGTSSLINAVKGQKNSATKSKGFKNPYPPVQIRGGRR